MSTDHPYIISLGGSLIIPQSSQQINIDYLLQFKQMLSTHIAQGKRFFIITGGGYTARQYQNAGRPLTNLDNSDLDWLGIYATHLNAQFVRTIMKEWSYPQIIDHQNQDLVDVESYPIVVSGGWHPGNSTDYIAVKIAEKYGAEKLMNLSNIDYVYTSDPKVDPEAIPLPQMTWTEFRSMVGETWDPRASAPFDPIASKEAESLNMEVVILNGENLDNLSKYIQDEDFVGTVIS